MAIAGKAVPAPVREARELELLEAVRNAATPAADLFGDAGELAAEDAAELATAEEVVRLSTGGGLRPALREVGGVMLGVAVVATMLLLLRSGWFVDLDIAHIMVAMGLAMVFIGWIVGRALSSAGLTVAAVSVLVASCAIAVAAISSATKLGSGYIAASNVSVLLVALILLTPGIAALVIAGRMPQQTLAQNWDDAAWLKRFRGGLRSRLMPAATAHEHAAEISQALEGGVGPAHKEFGHPLALARELADLDHTARSRRWWLSTIVGTVVPLTIATAIITMNSWGVFTIPVAVILLISSSVAPVVGWRTRPWAKSRPQENAS
ncbi:hypothetical protein FHX49_001268 [Microbacterium endophyticum]|uniref:Uncharacterized protein n=1 Tax=Microbacterium endophyticum TaxID=1526412 RepID=A0A7W4YNI0_9MICO|nr:hypothetical protein [Microbacterium endophyticum]MBB2975701.1 hypothetical protein [Microbacterium endophyticum]NIK36184.1 hypothetical protein [Microbacterium endophyticum]